MTRLDPSLKPFSRSASTKIWPNRAESGVLGGTCPRTRCDMFARAAARADRAEMPIAPRKASRTSPVQIGSWQASQIGAQGWPSTRDTDPPPDTCASFASSVPSSLHQPIASMDMQRRIPAYFKTIAAWIERLLALIILGGIVVFGLVS